MWISVIVIQLLAFTVVVFFLARYWDRRQFLKSRATLRDSELLDLFCDGTALDRNQVLLMLQQIGRFYGLPHGALRPTDTFGKPLQQLDMWAAGKGAMRLTWKLSREYNFNIARHSSMPLSEVLKTLFKGPKKNASGCLDS
jgi:hypothetical protein